MKKRYLATAMAAALAMSVVGTAWASTTISEPTVTFQRDGGVAAITSVDGVGSLFLSTPEGNDKITVLATDGGGITLGELDSLVYRNLRETGILQQTASLNITVTPWAGTFVYEPVYDSSYTVVDGEWLIYESIGTTGGWWRTDASPLTYTDFATQIQGFEDRVITSITVNQGGGNAGLATYTDWVEVNGERFDYGPAVRTKDDCKDGGWMTLVDDDGEAFRNQGQCVSSFQANERAGK